MPIRQEATSSAAGESGKGNGFLPLLPLAALFTLLFLNIPFLAYCFASAFSGPAMQPELPGWFIRVFALFAFLGIIQAAIAWGGVSLLKIRNPLGAAFVSFCAVTAGYLLALYCLSLVMHDRRVFPAGSATNEVRYAIVANYLIFAAISAAIAGFLANVRAGCPFSRKSGRWLRSYTFKQRFLIPETGAKLDEIPVGALLRAETTARKKGSFRMILYFDPAPDGEHRLGVAVFPASRFFTFRMFANQPIRRLHAITSGDADALMRKFGPVKKDWCYSPVSFLR